MKQDALKTVMLRTAFYYDNYKRAVLAFFVLLIVNVFLLGLIAYQFSHPPKPQYFAMTPDGRMINIHPLTDPVMDDAHVLQWAQAAVRATYRLDFVNFKKQLQDSSQNFTTQGWQWFLKDIKSSNNLHTIQNYKMVSNATVTGAPQILRKAVVDGHYAWKIAMPLYVTYTNGTRTIHQAVEVTLLVVREPVWQYPDRIAINNFIVNVNGGIA